MRGLRSNAYENQPPSLRMGEVIRQIDARERRWLLRCIRHELLHDLRVGGTLVLGLASSLLGISFLAVGERAIPLPVEISLVGIAIGLILMGGAMRIWLRLVRVEVVQYLLRLDRCGCCAHKRFSEKPIVFHVQPGGHGWTCTECGSTWWAGQADRSGLIHRDAA